MKLLDTIRPYIFFILITFFVGFSMYPTYYEYTKKDTIRPERQFELVHNFYTDFNFYLSRIRQGLEGNLSVHEKYTSEPHQGSFIHIMYLAMGWIGSWVRVPWERTSDIYHAARIVLAFALLFLISEIVKKAFWNNKQETVNSKHSVSLWTVFVFLIAVTASTYPIFTKLDDGSWRLGGYMPWWSVMDSLQRITFIPHLLAGQGLLAFLLLAVTDKPTMNKWGNWIFLGVLGFILGIIFPPGLVFVIASLPVYILVKFYFNFSQVKTGKKFTNFLILKIVPAAVFSFITIPSLIYLQLMTSFYPWKQLALADILHPLPFKFPEYFLAVGIVLPLGLFGLLIALIKKEQAMILSIVWVVTWALLLFIFRFIPFQSPLRFSEMIVHVPLGILTVYLFYSITQSRWYKVKFGSIESRIMNQESRIKENKRKDLRVLIPYAIFILPIGLVLLNLVHMYSSWLWQRDFVHHKIRAEIPLVPTGSYVMYPLRDLLDAFRFIQDHTNRNDIILSMFTAGNYIPVYSGNTVYLGHENTVNREEKELLSRSFFTGMMGVEAAYKFLKEENIKAVFWGPQEYEEGGGKDYALEYPFLKEVFKNRFTRVFTIQ